MKCQEYSIKYASIDGVVFSISTTSLHDGGHCHFTQKNTTMVSAHAAAAS